MAVIKVMQKDGSYVYITPNGKYDDTGIKADISNIKTDLGTAELTTTDKTVKGAINEVNTQFESIA